MYDWECTSALDHPLVDRIARGLRVIFGLNGEVGRRGSIRMHQTDCSTIDDCGIRTRDYRVDY